MIEPLARQPLSWRALTLGFFGVLLINLITPYNDYVLFNTFVVGNGLPLGAMLLFFVVAVFVNAPLSRYWPDRALSSGEMGIAMAMVLVGCALPSSALMRYLPPSLVAVFWQARGNYELQRLIESVNIAPWSLPSFASSRPADWMNDPIVTAYLGRWSGEGSPPYGAWVRPMLTWSIYVGLLYGAMLFLLTILRRQWYENERLPFPLANIQLALVEAPERGKWLNATMSSRPFWLCFAAVFLVHGWNALHLYFPHNFPEIPLGFDLQQILSDAPWRYANVDLKHATLFLTAMGVAFFLPGAMSFSMWFFFILWQSYHMVLGTLTGDANVTGIEDQTSGGMLMYGLIVLWIGRQHWALVIRQAFRGERPGEPRGRYLSYRQAFWGFCMFAAGMVLWLWLWGVTLGASVVLMLMLIGGLFIIARIVAESGWLQPAGGFWLTKPWTLLGTLGWTHSTTLSSVYHAGQLQLLHHDSRETFGVFASHGLRVVDQTAYGGGGMISDTDADRKLGRRLIVLFMAVVLVAYFSSFSSMLWVEYHYATQKNTTNRLVNDYATGNAVSLTWTGPTLNYDNSRYNIPHSPTGHLAFGMLFTLFLSVMRLNYTWWPLHPVGYLCMSSWPIGQLWFAIFLGWAIRTLVLRFGGARMYLQAKPAMLGVIIGEAVAAGFWMVMGIAISSMGWESRVVRILPE